jgi:signal transduction histidine kinase
MKHVFSIPLWRRYVIDSALAIGGTMVVNCISIAYFFSPGNPLVLYIYQYPYETIIFLYLFVTLALASTRGLYAAILASLLGLTSFKFFFDSPIFTFAPITHKNIFPLFMLFVSSIAISFLTSTQRKRALEATMRERELRILYAQAQELAAFRERHRLARELHDSVSQALYGISLGAHTIQEVLESESEQPEQAMASLAYVIALAEAGLAEMRALIFELRPESLETEGLVAALTKQIAVLQTRYKLTVDTNLGAEPELPLERKEALYRIAHEALHNTVKHARANMIILRLSDLGNEVSLEIGDNGRGFNPDGIFPGHLGLTSMRERAIKAGGTITIESDPGKGTRICVRVPR